MSGKRVKGIKSAHAKMCTNRILEVLASSSPECTYGRNVPPCPPLGLTDTAAKFESLKIHCDATWPEIKSSCESRSYVQVLASESYASATCLGNRRFINRRKNPYLGVGSLL